MRLIDKTPGGQLGCSGRLFPACLTDNTIVIEAPRAGLLSFLLVVQKKAKGLLAVNLV
jgi:hypothetical protein